MTEAKREVEVWVIHDEHGGQCNVRFERDDLPGLCPGDTVVRYVPESTPPAGAKTEGDWARLARWCSMHPKERRIGCNENAGANWKVWAEWNDCTVEVGAGATADDAAAELCDKLATRHPSSALPSPPKPPEPR